MMTNTPPFPFQNPDLPLETRLDDLVARLSLDEKISQFSLPPESLALIGADGKARLEAGQFRLRISGSSPGPHQADGAFVKMTFELIA